MRKCISQNRCQNDALCMERFDNSYDDFYCYCAPDYYGKLCELRFDECEPNDCQNGATCIDQVDSYRCACPSHFAGKYCEINCESDPNDESCVSPSTTSTAVLQTLFIDSSMIELPQSTAGIIEPSLVSITSDVSIQSTEMVTSTKMIESSILGTESIQISPTVTSVVTPTPTVSFPESPISEKAKESVKRIFAPNFNGIDSMVLFRTRRVKRMSSQFRMSIISENDDGSILMATTNKYKLLVYLKNLLVVVELLEQGHQLLHFQSSVPIKLNVPYSIKLTISSLMGSIYVELNIFDGNSQLIHSVSNRKNNHSVPCFEQFQLGLFANNVAQNEPFRGCIFDININEEEKFAKDSYSFNNITECLSDVCNLNPCQNDAICANNNTGWLCSCADGYRGWLCEETFCDANYCHHGGLCLLQDKRKHMCLCSHGFFGDRCEFSKLKLLY